MRTLVIMLCLASSVTVLAQYNSANLALNRVGQARYQFKNLQIFPIRANATFTATHRDVGKYTRLKSALEKKKIAITEVHRGDVNTLLVENTSRDTIMILAGEVVQGGKQDRVIAQDFILYPGSGKKDIAVFCVEHGRWTPKNSGMEFKQYFDFSSNDVRKAATVDKSQQKVWDEVEEITSANNASTSTGTLAALKQSGNLDQELKAYGNFFQNVILGESDVIGVIAASGDEVLGCDMFATHALLSEHYASLINSYATEAITTGKPPKVTYEMANTYLQKLIGNESRQEEEVKKRGAILKDGKRKLHISTF